MYEVSFIIMLSNSYFREGTGAHAENTLLSAMTRKLLFQVTIFIIIIIIARKSELPIEFNAVPCQFIYLYI